jgi:glyoxylase-like metal-dependent hydrolase (beta-lactamase superfamily II)
MAGSPVTEIAPGVFRVADTCNVYVVRAEHAEGERTAFAVDFGSGRALEHLSEMGVDRITDVLMTHHHRDQGQGLPRAVAAGIRVHVPPVEFDLFAHVDEMWRTRRLWNDYNLRQDRFSLLDPVPVHDVVPEYRTRVYAGTGVEVVPTPGHTTGSVSYLVERDGRRLAFTGDLLYAPGKVWSLASTQWSYSENEGPAMTVLSCYQLMERGLDLLLPSHGQVMDDPFGALQMLARRMQRYVDSRRAYPWDLRGRLDNPYVPVTEHLLLNDTSESHSYVLLSDSGAALLIDYGFDMITGLPPADGDRASRRPWLASIPALRRQYGVTNIEVALITHYHDDHVAGLNLLRDVEGTEVWASANVAPVVERPMVHDLPCTWYDQIPIDRELPLGETFTWREYEITVHELAGHTLYAAAYEFVVDGHTVLVTGDQQDGYGVPGERRNILNYQYRSRFRIEDFRSSAALYRRVAPDLMISGHWLPRWVDGAFLDQLAEEGEEVVQVHQELLPLEELDLGADSILARITPYFSTVRRGAAARFTVTVRNPKPVAQCATLRLVAPLGWCPQPGFAELVLPAFGEKGIEMEVVVHGPVRRRTRVAVDVRIGDLELGQHAEALVDVIEAG